MAGRLDGRVALVTGSGQSIGRAIALRLAEEGAAVVTNSRRPVNDDGTPTASQTTNEIVAAGGRAVPVFADVGTMAGARAVVDAAVEHFGGLDFSVNTVGGFGEAGPLTTISLAGLPVPTAASTDSRTA